MKTSEKQRGAAAPVLVVDDQPQIRNLLVTALRRSGVRVDSVEDGGEAIRRLSARVYRVLVLDLMMPKVSGWNVIEWIAAHADRKPHSVIVVSAAERETMQQLDPNVVNAVIFKPFDIFEVTAYVEACSRARTTQDRRKRRVVGS